MERGHPPFYAALAKLAKDPHAAPPVSETPETFLGNAYTFYRYGHQPLAIPIDGLELHVRAKNHASWFFIVRPEHDPGLFVEDFAPAGGTASLGTDVPENGASVEDMVKATSLMWSIGKGPLAGAVLFLRGDKTFTIKSHPEAYPHG